MTVAIITARSGSKSLPNKNIQELGGIPLLAWTIKAISKSKLVSNIILSTDSDDYFRIGSKFNNKLIYHKRPPPLAEDVPSEFVILDVMNTLKQYFDNPLLVLVQPTTPFITYSDIDECIKKMMNNPNVNSCITVKSVSEYPEWQLVNKEGHTDICVSGILSGEISVRQNLRKRWIPNGGVYVIRKTFLEKTGKIVDEEGILIHEMPKIRSVDINDQEDFTLCEALVNSGFIVNE
ncbi:MAG TPA: acylneuraminate cytidylyltransferase family protein [Nitrosopumilaceae archaeon]|nr:acylneuraminate cytidylyltransferase family protein [Nitrosopumilaceae archaeon]